VLKTRLLPWAASAAFWLALSQAAAPQVAGNLLQNPGAEAGAGATDSTAILAMPGWASTGSFTAVAYTAPGSPPAPSGAGANYFAGGPGQPLTTAMQTVDVSASAGAIDAGQLQATLSGYLGGFAGQGDSAVVGATFLDASGTSLGSVAIGPVTTAERGGQSALLPRSATAAVPDFTRTIRVVISAERTEGNYNDGYADELALVLEPSATPRKTTVYLWSGRASSLGDSGAVLASQTISGSGSSTLVTQSGRTSRLAATGSFRVVWRYRRPAGKTRTLSLAVVGPASPVVARSGGGGRLSVRIRIRRSDFSSCDVGDYGIITLVDRAGEGRDSLELSVCHTKTRYVDRGPHRTRVFALIGERR
jgi:hypothetical protein